MKRILIAAAVTLFGAGYVAATPNGSALMKGNGRAVGGTLAPTVRGEKPYDQAAIDAALTTLADTAAKLPTLYPDSMKGAAPAAGEFGPSAKVFDDKAGYAAQVKAFADAITAAKASVKDVDTLKAALPNITKVCSSCHEDFRVKG